MGGPQGRLPYVHCENRRHPGGETDSASDSVPTCNQRRPQLRERVGRLGLEGRAETRSAIRHRKRRVVREPERRNPDDARRVSEGVRERLRLHLRSEEHTSELQSLTNLVCRLLLEKKK